MFERKPKAPHPDALFTLEERESFESQGTVHGDSTHTRRKEVRVVETPKGREVREAATRNKQASERATVDGLGARLADLDKRYAKEVASQRPPVTPKETPLSNNPYEGMSLYSLDEELEKLRTALKKAGRQEDAKWYARLTRNDLFHRSSEKEKEINEKIRQVVRAKEILENTTLDANLNKQLDARAYAIRDKKNEAQREADDIAYRNHRR